MNPSNTQTLGPKKETQFLAGRTPKFVQTTLLSALFFLLLGVGESWGQTTVFSETFDGTWTTAGTLSPAWTSVGSGNNQWQNVSNTAGWTSATGAYTPTGANSTSGSARFHTYDSSNGTTGDLITPTINMSTYSAQDAFVEFYVINSSGSDKIDVYISLDDGVTYGSSRATFSAMAGSWNLIPIYLGKISTSQLKIKLTATSDYGASDIGIDAFAVKTYSNLTSITTYGDGSFIVPQGVCQISISAWGAGGSGGTGNSNSSNVPNRAGGGGAGGTYVNHNLTVTPGATYTYSVGKGGLTPTTVNTNGNIGGNTVFGSNNVVANGGAAGLAGNPGSGATAVTTNSIGTTQIKGGNGAAGVNSTAGGGGGSSGGFTTQNNASGATGGSAPTGGVAGGSAPSTGGGQGYLGGGGGSGSRGGYISGNGGNGKLTISWSTPSVSAVPIVSSICAGATSISGTSTEANGTSIEVFNGATSLGTTTVTSGAWTKSGLTALASGASITAKATASCKTVSAASSTVTVQSVSAAPAITGNYCPGATTVTGTGVSGASISVIRGGSSIGTATVGSGGTWSATVSTLAPSDVLTATQTESGNCVSAASSSVTVQSISTAPAITGTICSSATTVSGTGINGSSINVLRSGSSIGTATVSGGVWSATVSSLAANDVLTATQTESGKCVSAASASATVIACSPPTVSSFSPSSGCANGQIVISGTNLSTVTAVTVNGNAVSSFTINSGTQITATLGSGTTSGSVSVTNPYGTATSSSTYTVYTIGWANTQYPATGTICPSGSFDVYGQIYAANLTPPTGAGSGIVAQLGYSTSNTNPNTWTNWVSTTFNTESGNNDEYKGTLSGLAAGTYYYAFRYTLGTGCSYTYGGTAGVWNNDNGTLTVNANHAIALSSAAGTTSQTVCVNNALTAISYTLSGGATGASVSGLPSGVSASVSGTTLTISGTPSVAGSYSYSITTSGNSCTTASASGTITVGDTINWANTQYPASGTICSSGTFTIYGQVYQPGVTNAAGQGAGITVEYGYSTTSADPTSGSGWTWANATYNPTSSGNNDEYMGTLSGLSAGTYNYAFRYKLTASTACGYQYGGYNATGGGFWNGTTNACGVLTIDALPTAGTLSGTQAICSNGTSTFSSTVSGGTWTSGSTGIATINSTTGAITAVAAGTATMTYTVSGTGACSAQTATATRTVTVTAAPTAGTLTGTQAICSNGTSTFSSSVSGGTWTSGNTGIATINSTTGAITPLTAGTATMTYTVTGIGGCSNVNDTRTVTVTALPTAGTLSGTQAICVNGTTTFSSTVSGGAWSSGGTSIATINSTTGAITPLTAGTATMTYTVTGTGGCSNATATRSVTVSAAPTGITTTAAASNASVCAGGTSSLSLSVLPLTETFEVAPFTKFTVSNTAGTGAANQNSTYYAEGSNSVLFSTASTSADVQFTLASGQSLANPTSSVLTFSHICATEAGWDYGYVQYSTDGGTTWTSFPTTSYSGAGTLKNSVVSFDKSSYTDWATQFTTTTSTPGTGPATSLWKTETINLPSGILNSTNFKIRFRYTTDSSANYFGWLIDNVKITNTYSTYSWSNGSSTIGSTNPYVATVNSTTTFTGTATLSTGCSVSASTTVNALSAPVIGTQPTALTKCVGQAASFSVVASGTGLTYQWKKDGVAITGATAASYSIAAVSVADAGSFSVDVTGCNTTVSSSAVALSVNANPTAVATSNGPVCANANLTLTGTSDIGTSFAWTGPNTFTSTTQSPTISAVTSAAAGTYTFTATSNGCSTSGTVSVTVNPVPSSLVIPAATICNNDIATLVYSTNTATTTQIGSGTANSAAANTPYRQGINTTQSRVQYLVTKSELNAAGIVGPTMLTSIGFNVLTAGAGAMPSYTISLANSALTALTASYVSSGFTTVFSATNLLPVSGINTHNFQTYFTWDGNSNIVVNICHTGTNGTTSVVEVSTPTIVSTVSGAAAGQCSVASGTTSNNRPNVYFGSNNSSTITWTPSNTLYTDAAANSAYSGTSATTIYAIPTTTTTYTATATSAAGCTSSNTVQVTVNPLPTATISAGSATTFCSGGSVELTASAGSSYVWKKDGVAISGATAQTYTATTAGAYTVTVTNVNGCSATSAATTVTVNTLPNMPTASNVTLCGTGSVTLTADNPGIGLSVNWYNAAQTTQLAAASLTYTTPSLSTTTSYYAETVNTSTGCVSTNRVEVQAIVNVTNTFTDGSGDHSWFTAGNWSCGSVPNATTNVVIPTGKQVSIAYSTGSGPAVAGTVSLEGTANLTVTSGRSIVVTDNVNVASTALFTVENSASLLQVNSTIANVGSIKVKKATENLGINDCVFWSSPVQNATMTMNTFAPNSSNFYWTFNSAVVNNADATSASYSWVGVAPSATFEAGKGYYIKTPNTQTAGTPWTTEFNGTPNNGTIELVYPVEGDITERYYFVGNPYPSAISIDAFMEANAAYINKTIYLFREPNGNPGTGYSTVNKNPENVISFQSNGSGVNPSGVIPSGQGFLVRLLPTATIYKVVFNNGMRVSDNYGRFNRSAQNSEDAYNLKLTAANARFSQAKVGYYENASNQEEASFDVRSMDDGAFDLGTLLNQKNFKVQARAAYNVSDIVYLRFKTNVAGEHRISLSDTNGVFAADQMVIIKDNLTGVQHNLTANGDYVFTATAGTFTNRFEVVYQQAYYTALQANSCGATIANMNSLVYADIVNGATGYRFKVVNNTTAAVQTIDRPQHWFAFNMLSSYDYNTPYTISVQVQKDGVWTGYYGATCTVNSPNIAATGVMQINPSQCGATLATLGTVIATTPVAGATGYKFRITNTTAGATGSNMVQEITRSNHWFTLGMLSRYNYGSSYTVEVAVKTTGAFTPYGNACTVYSPSAPTLASCGQTVATATTLVRTTAMTLATQYRFQVTRMSTQETITFDTANFWFSFRVNVPGYAAGEQYGVRVAVMTAGSWSPFGDACDITAPIASARSNEEASPSEANLFKPVAYPNPFKSAFSIALATPFQDDVTLVVYDLQGRLIEKQTVPVSLIDTIHIGANYQMGDYMLVVSQGSAIESMLLHKE